jgi:hypothetical protein
MRTYTDKNKELSKPRSAQESVADTTQLAQVADTRSEALAQKKVKNAIVESPVTTAQKQNIQKMFGGTAQREVLDENKVGQKKSKGVSQLKKASVSVKNSGFVAQLVKDKNKQPEIDQRMDDLKNEAITILTAMKELGEDWELKYGAKGKEKGGKILSGEKTDYKAEIRRAALKELWANLSLEEKFEMVKVGATLGAKGLGLVGKGGSELVRALPSSGRKDKEKVEKEPEEPKPEEDKEPSVSWLSNLSQEDMEALYEVYKLRKRALEKIAKIKAQIEEGAGEIGESIGIEIGQLRDEADFNTRMKALKFKFLTARKRFEFLEAAITENQDMIRYQSEIDALHYGLMNAIFGPAKVYQGRDLSKVERKQHPDLCQDAIANIKSSGPLVRGGVGGFFESGLGLLGGIVESSKEKERKKGEAQSALAIELQRVLGLSWSNLTSWGWTPTGVKSIRTELPKQGTPLKKLEKAIELAKVAAVAESGDRKPETQIFYAALANLKINDTQSLKLTQTIVTEIGTKLG